MNKNCTVCRRPLNNLDLIAAVVKSRFNLIPSRTIYAIEKPHDVVDIQHWECAKGFLVPMDDESVDED